MSEITFKATEGQIVTVARSAGTPALAGATARVVIETSYTNLEVMQALRVIEADLEASFRTTGGRFAGEAFSDNARFADGASFSDQNTLGL
jgi:hypothetical protein